MTTLASDTGKNVLEYITTLGILAMEGRGFEYPTDTVIAKNGRLYVTNRSRDMGERGVRVTVLDIDSEYYGTFGHYGQGEGQLSSWGVRGSGNGELNGPSGIAFDYEDNVYIADTHNNRVQKFTAGGEFIFSFGSKGADEGQLDLPWGVTVAPSGDVYVADWGNDRIQQFSADSEFIATYGVSGRGDGEFLRPSGVAVDERGYLYVSDWGNERIQILDTDGAFLQKLRGQATLSKWAANFLEINIEEGEARSKANLEPDTNVFDPEDPHAQSAHIEKLFWAPMSIKLDDSGKVYVTEGNRHRIQVYQRTS